MKCEVWIKNYEVWSLNSEVWTVKCEVRTMKSELLTVNCEVWTLNCEVWSVDCEVGTGKCELRGMNCEVWSPNIELWSMKCELRTVKYELGFEFRWRWDSVLTGMALHCTEHFMFTIPSSWYDLNTVEKDVKPQIIHPWIMNFEMALSVVFYTTESALGLFFKRWPLGVLDHFLWHGQMCYLMLLYGWQLIQHWVLMYFQVCSNSAYPQHSGERYRTNGPLVLFKIGCRPSAVPLLVRHNVVIIGAASWQNQQCGCTPSLDSDQPGHPPSLISVFAVRMKKAWVLSGCPGWSESSLGAKPHCWFCHEAAHCKCSFPIWGLGRMWNSTASVFDHCFLSTLLRRQVCCRTLWWHFFIFPKMHQ